MIIGFLLIVQVLLFIGGWIFTYKTSPNTISNMKLPRPIRLLISSSLVISAFLIFEDSDRNTPIYSLWVFIGMVFSFLGDLSMAEVLPFPDRIIGGMLFFAIAHGLYITAYIKAIQFSGYSLVYNNYIFAIAFEIIVLIIWKLFINNPKIKISINLCSLIYSLWIGFMVFTAFVLAAVNGGIWWAAAFGALTFMASDLIIAITKIRRVSFKSSEILIWFTYLLGQIGIIYTPWFLSAF